MQIKKGNFYFIKDYYYDKVQDDELMKNKERGVKRPCFYCFKDSILHDLFWLIPISSKVEKYKRIYDRKVQRQIENNKNINVDTLVFGNINNEVRVFLIQNMFPITKRFISDIYVRNNLPVRISYELQKEIEMKANKVFTLVRRGNRGLVFPNIINIKNIMIKELNREKQVEKCALGKLSINQLKEIVSSCISKEEIKDYIDIIFNIDNDLGQEIKNIYNATDTLEECKEKIIKYIIR